MATKTTRLVTSKPEPKAVTAVMVLYLPAVGARESSTGAALLVAVKATLLERSGLPLPIGLATQSW